MKVWLPKDGLATKNAELWQVHYEEPKKDLDNYHLVEVPDFQFCTECMQIAHECFCDPPMVVKK